MDIPFSSIFTNILRRLSMLLDHLVRWFLAHRKTAYFLSAPWGHGKWLRCYMAFVRVKSSMDLWRSYTKDRTKAHEIMCAVVKTGIVSTQLLNIPVLIQEIWTFIKWATKQSSQSFWMQRSSESSESSEWIPSEILSGWKLFRFDHPHDERPAISHGISTVSPRHLLSGGVGARHWVHRKLSVQQNHIGLFTEAPTSVVRWCWSTPTATQDLSLPAGFFKDLSGPTEL